MAAQYVWTAWTLTPEGWQRGEDTDDPTDAVRDRPDDTVLVLLSKHHPHDPIAPPIITTLFRSPDGDAVVEALAKHGGKPAD